MLCGIVHKYLLCILNPEILLKIRYAKMKKIRAYFNVILEYLLII